MHIPAILTHPEIMGPPLERGIRYAHHFVVELISDGKRLWAVDSEEGKRVIHQIEHGIDPSAPIPPRRGPTIAEWMDAGYKAANYPPSGYEAVSTPAEIAQAVDREQASEVVVAQSGTGTEVVTDTSDQSLDPDGKPATGGAPQPIAAASTLPDKAGEPPTTTVTSATSFDS